MVNSKNDTRNDRQILKVVWLDAHSRDSVLENEIPEMLKLAPYDVIGYRVAETAKVLVIAQAVLGAGNGIEQNEYRRVLAIPKSLIQSREELVIRKDQ